VGHQGCRGSQPWQVPLTLFAKVRSLMQALPAIAPVDALRPEAAALFHAA